MISRSRLQPSLKAGVLHVLASLVVAGFAAALVFGIWYPNPYSELSGGRDLFWLVAMVDIICGPLLTMVLFDPSKPKAELLRDLGLVVLIQVAALGYGLNTVWQARPLFLVQDIDRFTVVAAPDLGGASLEILPDEIHPKLWLGPITVAIRPPTDEIERKKILFESIEGGKDYAQRPEFYLPYEGAAALKSLKRAKPLAVFLEKRPDQKNAALELATKKGVDISLWLYLPIRARQDWVAVIDKQGQIQGYLEGDGL